MGNIYATDAGAVASPPMSAPTLVPGVGTAQPNVQGSPPTPAEETNNPGTYEELHRKCKEIFPVNFEGAKLLVNKGLSNHFQISHTVTMSSAQPSGYKFGCTYVGTKQFGPQESFPVLMGEIDPSGSLNANIIHRFTKGLQSKFVAQIQNSKWLVAQSTTDYRGENFTASATLGNPDLLNGSGVVVAQYLQRVAKGFDLGAELVTQSGSQVPGGIATVLSVAGRYATPDWQFSGNVTPMSGALNGCYYHKISENMQVGVELETVLKMQESKATIGYQIDLPQADLQFKGQLDSNWCIGAVLEKKLTPVPFTLVLSGYANHVKAQYRFGVGLMVG